MEETCAVKASGTCLSRRDGRGEREDCTRVQATTMGPFVLCSMFLITPRTRARADTPPNPLRSRKDRESGLCKDDNEGKKHASLMHWEHPSLSPHSRRHPLLLLLLSKTRGFDSDNLSKRFSQRKRAHSSRFRAPRRGFVWLVRQFCVYAIQARCDTRVCYVCSPRRSEELRGYSNPEFDKLMDA